MAHQKMTDKRFCIGSSLIEQEGEVGCEGSERVVVGTARVAVIPPDDSSDSDNVSDLTGMTREVVDIPLGGVVVLQCQVQPAASLEGKLVILHAAT